MTLTKMIKYSNMFNMKIVTMSAAYLLLRLDNDNETHFSLAKQMFTKMSKP